MLSSSDRKTLLQIARSSLAATLKDIAIPPPEVDSEDLQAPCGAFVTLRNNGRLRGCIGTFTSDKPLARVVQEMAASALADPRFVGDRVTLDELPDIDIEISALSPLEKMDDPLNELELGKHGIMIRGPFGSGCFLPQVAEETGWGVEEFLAQCCAGKAGLPRDAWLNSEVDVCRFEAEVFGESDVEGTEE